MYFEINTTVCLLMAIDIDFFWNKEGVKDYLIKARRLVHIRYGTKLVTIEVTIA